MILHFGAVDYKSFVYINGQLAGTHEGGYSSFEIDITGFLNGENETIVVCAEDDIRNSAHASGKQSKTYYSHGCYYTRVTGIWQTVWLELVPEKHIKRILFYPDRVNKVVNIRLFLEQYGQFALEEVSAEIYYEGRLVGSSATKTSSDEIILTVPLDELHLWEPGCGRLYDVVLKYSDDEVKSYFGIRDIGFSGKKFLLNGKPLFMRLVLDQGYYRDGIYTAPSDEALKKDIELALNMGFNGARLHEKVFEPRFLYHCDRMGYIVWGEYGNWGLDYSSNEALYTVLPEWAEIVNRDINHPSIIGWCPFNETWDYEGRRQDDRLLKIIYDMTKMLDPSRPCIDTSGNYHVKTDVFDVHDYNQNPDQFKKDYDKLMDEGVLTDRFIDRQKYQGQPVMISEYGGIKWAVGVDEENCWGYGKGPKTEEEFIERYRKLTEAILENNCIFGFCYTQLYDVEQEVNGLYTYDRVPKFDSEIIRTINTKKAAIEE